MYKVLRTFALESGKVQTGDIISISESRAKDLIEAGFIEVSDGEPKHIFLTDEEKAALKLKEEKGNKKTKEEK